MKIAILGFGNIGSYFYGEVVSNHREVTVGAILMRDPSKKREIQGGLSWPEKLVTTDFSTILNDRTIDAVVDVTAGPGSAEYIAAALAAGKSVVTANKMAVSTRGREFLAKAREMKVNFYFEACVGGGIPVINLFNENVKFHRIDRITGILNGTTNYILTRMADEGMEFSDALKLAQEKGFAEPDPAFDISGRDSAYKISILKDLLFDANVRPEDIFCQGIERIGKVDLAYARSINYQIRLVGYIENRPEGIDVGVRPVFLPQNHPLSSVKNEFNAVYIEGKPIGEVMLFGRGAGQGPTTASLVSDLLRIQRGPGELFNPSYIAQGSSAGLIPAEVKKQGNYFRFRVLDVTGVISRITSIFEKYDISISSMRQEVSHEDCPIDIIFTTHVAKTIRIPEMLEAIKKFDFVIGEPLWYRIEM